MPIDLAVLGVAQPSIERTWRLDDAMLYAIAVGAGGDDPTTELEFTTENTAGVSPRVLPTFLNVLARYGAIALGEIDRARLVHAGQAFELDRPIPTDGTVRSVSTVTACEDLGSAALIRIDTDVRDGKSGRRLGHTTASLYLKGEGGFGGGRSPSKRWEPPQVAPVRRPWATTPSQALLYRLTGDRNPLHTDPAVAVRGGFDRPILHGMCVYGIAGRALLAAGAVDGLDHIASMTARFSAPVRPGDGGDVLIWRDGATCWFQVISQTGVVVDRGQARLANSRTTLSAAAPAGAQERRDEDVRA